MLIPMMYLDKISLLDYPCLIKAHAVQTTAWNADWLLSIRSLMIQGIDFIRVFFVSLVSSSSTETAPTILQLRFGFNVTWICSFSSTDDRECIHLDTNCNWSFVKILNNKTDSNTKKPHIQQMFSIWTAKCFDTNISISLDTTIIRFLTKW